MAGLFRPKPNHRPVGGIWTSSATLGAAPRWSSDGKRIAYLDGSNEIIRGLDGSTLAVTSGDPRIAELARRGDESVPLLSPSGAWTARVELATSACDLVVAKPNGTATHIFPLGCPYALGGWSPDGRQVLVLQDVGDAFALIAIAVDRPGRLTVVPNVGVNSDRSWPSLGDVSWQPVFP